MLAFSGERVTVIGAGRTDTGVHAPGQVAHFDLASEQAARRGPRRAQLSSEAQSHRRRRRPKIVAGRFHARFSATGRRYRYRILNRRAPPALDRGRVWHVPVPLDVDAMADAAARAGRPPRLQQLPLDGLPGAVLDQDARPARRARARASEIRIDVGRALLPAQPGAHPGRHAADGRPRPMEPARRRGRRWPRATARAPARPRRRRGSASSKCATT